MFASLRLAWKANTHKLLQAECVTLSVSYLLLLLR